MSSPETGHGQAEMGSTAASASLTTVACNRCRKTKLKCSRDRPKCAHCVKARQQCFYEAKRAKPGVKVGAIESIHHRLDKLEKKALDSDASSTNKADGSSSATTAENVLALLARELPKLLSPSHHEASPNSVHEVPTESPSNKRRRLESPTERHDDSPNPFVQAPPFPSRSVRHTVTDIYFSHMHPWIPMLHQDRFRARVDGLELSDEMLLLIHAMALSVFRYLPVGELPWPGSRWEPSAVRKWILVASMEEVTLEGMQALILLAFDDINNGNARKAWSLVAALSRTVEFAQLTMEHNNSDPRQPVCPPSSHLPPARDWADLEERRRIFWNVFHLDRLCSITMGWNTSLTSIDVHQRLPCDGILWRRQQEAVLTPYLGIWDKTTGGIGNKTRAPHRSEQEAHSTIDSYLWTPQPVISSGSPEQLTSGGTDMSKVGSFGFCIEAIESMSRVTTYFLQQRVNMGDTKEVEAWLSRFKELDLRLAHWKTFLPLKWRAGPALSTATPNTRMDPNLTLAHITHNASTILLHQVIAFPPNHWAFRQKLPSAWSVDTCCCAGTEIATITQKYLESTPAQLPVASPLLAFCLFLAARMMLINWKFAGGGTLLDEFWSLKLSLEEISRRWRCVQIDDAVQPTEDQAAIYAKRLESLYQSAQREKNCQISVTAYTQDGDRYVEAVQTIPPQHSPSFPQQPYNLRGGRIPQPSFGQGIQPPLQVVGSGESNSAPAFGTEIPPHLQLTLDGQQAAHLSHIDLSSNLDDYFVDMDRVIAFNDGSLFTAEWDNYGW